jgi:hypothetical protein
MERARIARALIACGLVGCAALPAAAHAAVYETGFEAPSFTAGPVGTQDGWSQGVPALDAEIETHSQGQSLRMSNAATSGAFHQVLSPELAEPAAEDGHSRFDASFRFAAADDEMQDGLSLHVSPDDGDGSRMTAVRIQDAPGGLVVNALDSTDKGPGQAAGWTYTPVAVDLDRTLPHTLRFALALAPGAANDVVKIFVDGQLVHTGPSWEQYYRHDPEQAGNGNVVPDVTSVLFLAHSMWDGQAPALAGAGLLFDDVRVESSTPAPPGDTVDPPAPPSAPAPPADDTPDPPAVDDSPPKLSVGGSAAARGTMSQGGFLRKTAVSLPLSCSERCTVRASGRLSLRRGGKRIALKLVRRTVPAGGRATVKLRLSRQARVLLRRSLRRGKRVTASVVIQVSDAAGNVRTVRRTIRLRR